MIKFWNLLFLFFFLFNIFIFYFITKHFMLVSKVDSHFFCDSLHYIHFISFHFFVLHTDIEANKKSMHAFILFNSFIILLNTYRTYILDSYLSSPKIFILQTVFCFQFFLLPTFLVIIFSQVFKKHQVLDLKICHFFSSYFFITFYLTGNKKQFFFVVFMRK